MIPNFLNILVLGRGVKLFFQFLLVVAVDTVEVIGSGGEKLRGVKLPHVSLDGVTMGEFWSTLHPKLFRAFKWTGLANLSEAIVQLFTAFFPSTVSAVSFVAYFGIRMVMGQVLPILYYIWLLPLLIVAVFHTRNAFADQLLSNMSIYKVLCKTLSFCIWSIITVFQMYLFLELLGFQIGYQLRSLARALDNRWNHPLQGIKYLVTSTINLIGGFLGVPDSRHAVQQRWRGSNPLFRNRLASWQQLEVWQPEFQELWQPEFQELWQQSFQELRQPEFQELRQAQQITLPDWALRGRGEWNPQVLSVTVAPRGRSRHYSPTFLIDLNYQSFQPYSGQPHRLGQQEGPDQQEEPQRSSEVQQLIQNPRMNDGRPSNTDNCTIS